MPKDDNAIVVKDLYKSFNLPHEQSSGLKQNIVNFVKRKKGYEVQEVLKGISFEIKQGEFFGIVGRNGSGKSTLLKLLAQIYTPDKGQVSIHGSLTPFIELGVGFNPELSGRENVFLNGALLGFSRHEMEGMYDDIVEFAELERFMDQRLKNYSSGMQVRLAFSIAIRADTDILILDEVLAVGDSAFQQKCFDYFASLKDNKKTVVLVSHSMSSIERFCTRALLLEKGEVARIGSSSDVAYLYENLFIEDSNIKYEDEQKPESDTVVGEGMRMGIAVFQDDKKVTTVRARAKFHIEVSITSAVKQANLNVGINIRNKQDQIVFSTDMRKKTSLIDLDSGQKAKVIFTIDNYYTNGEYFIDLAVVNERSVADKLLYKEKALAKFDIKGIREHAHSLFHPEFDVTVEREA